MRRFIFFLCIGTMAAAAVAGALPARAGFSNVTPNTLDSLEEKLKTAATPADSIPLLYNYIDAFTTGNAQTQTSTLKLRGELWETMYNVATRAGNTEVAMDALCNLGVSNMNNNKQLESIISRIETFPASDARNEALAFVRLQSYRTGARDTTLTMQQRRERLKQIAAASTDGPKDIYSELDRQLALSIYGGPLVQPERLEMYLDSLGKLVEHIESARSPIKNFFYAQAPVLYNEMERFEKANRTDYRLLEILDSLDADNLRRGRVFKSYDTNRFIVYRRLLSNYPLITLAETNSIYRTIKKLEANLPKGSISSMDSASVEAFYHLAHGRYADALPNLRRVMTSLKFQRKPRYINSYMEAAMKAGSMEDLVKAQDIYITQLRQQVQKAIEEDYARMVMTYDLEQIEKRHTLEKEALQNIADRNRRIAAQRTTILLLVGLGIFLVLIVLILVISQRRTRKLAKRLKNINEELVSERDSLKQTQKDLTQARDRARLATRQKTDFIHNVSYEISEPVKAITGYTQLIIDSIPLEHRRYMDRFVKIVEDNSVILQRLVADVLESAESDNVVTTIVPNNFEISQIRDSMEVAYAMRTQPDVTLELKPLKVINGNPGDTGCIDTDRARVEQVLVNLLNNAVQFTEKGTITVECTVDRKTRTAQFTITDTGVGVPADKSEVIFEKFEKLGKYSRGLGLGLFVSRRIARALGGDVKLDKSWRQGARFVFTIPTSYTPKV